MSLAAAAPAVKGRSLWDDARRRLFRNGAAVASMAALAVLVLAAVVGPSLVPFTYDQVPAGQTDPTLAELTDRAATAIPHAQIHVLHGHGHFAHKTDPALVGDIVRTFLAT